MSRLLIVAAVADLLFALCWLLCWELGWLVFSRQSLLLVNTNMLACALAAVACAGLPLGGLGAPPPERRLQALLLAVVACLLCAELVAMAEEFLPWARDLRPWSTAPVWAARLLSGLLLAVALISRLRQPLLRRWLPLAGLGLYHLTDLLYMLHTADGAGEFGLAELGFYCGYWMIAVGSWRPRQPAS